MSNPVWTRALHYCALTLIIIPNIYAVSLQFVKFFLKYTVCLLFKPTQPEIIMTTFSGIGDRDSRSLKTLLNTTASVAETQENLKRATQLFLILI